MGRTTWHGLALGRRASPATGPAGAGPRHTHLDGEGPRLRPNVHDRRRGASRPATPTRRSWRAWSTAAPARQPPCPPSAAVSQAIGEVSVSCRKRRMNVRWDMYAPWAGSSTLWRRARLSSVQGRTGARPSPREAGRKRRQEEPRSSPGRTVTSRHDPSDPPALRHSRPQLTGMALTPESSGMSWYCPSPGPQEGVVSGVLEMFVPALKRPSPLGATVVKWSRRPLK